MTPKQALAAKALREVLGHAEPPATRVSAETQRLADTLAGVHRPKPGSALAELQANANAEPTTPEPVRSVPSDDMQRAVDVAVETALRNLGLLK